MSEARIAAVTGASGLAGGAIVRHLLQQGYRVRALVRNHESLVGRPNLELFAGDLLNTDALDRLCRGVELVFNAAGHVDDWGPARTFFEVNTEGAERLCAAAQRARVGRLVHLSTVDVFGFRRHAVVTEDSPRVAEAYAYSRSKLEGEERVWNYSRSGLSVSVVYPTWIFGPGDRHFLPELVGALRRGEWVHLDGGTPHLEVTFSENLAAACLLIAQNPEAVGQGYILGDGYGTTLRTFVEALVEPLGIDAPKRSVPYWLAYGLTSLLEWGFKVVRPGSRPPMTRYALRALANGGHYDLSKLHALGYRPSVGLRDALRRSLEVSDAPAVERSALGVVRARLR